MRKNVFICFILFSCSIFSYAEYLPSNYDKNELDRVIVDLEKTVENTDKGDSNKIKNVHNVSEFNLELILLLEKLSKEDIDIVSKLPSFTE